MDYLWGGEGRSRVKHVVMGVSEAHGRGVGEVVKVDSVFRAKQSRLTACSGQNSQGQWRALGPEAAACFRRSGRGRG
jgi:hypothetical protein